MKHFRHYLLTALLAVLSAASAWAQPAAVKPTQGDGSKSAPYVLNTVENMKWLMDNYNSNTPTDCGLYFSESNYYLNADIDLAPITNWKPLGGRYFTGTFNGGNHTLSHLTSSGYAVGLFVNLANCTISDLTLADVNLQATSSVGAVASYGSSTTPVHPFTLRNIMVTGTISTTSSCAGGLVGATAAGEITNCTNMANVTASAGFAGGIVGSQQYQESVMEGCVNFGTILGNSDNVGGLAGSYQGRISNCCNKGEVTLNSRYCVGGLVGFFCGNGSVIDHCLNEGNVSGPNSAGMLLGMSQDDVTMTNCGWDASATLNGNTTTSNVCGIVSGSLTKNDVMAFSASDLSSGKATYLLQDDQSTLWWSQRVGTEDWPVFNRQPANFRVYFQGTIHCDGSYEGRFTNTSATTYREDHDFGTTGICSHCSEATPAPLVGDVYQIGNAGQLLWFSRLLRDGNKASSNAVLTDDIDLSVFCHPADYDNYLESVDWEPIGDQVSSYLGTFDGQNHTISGLYMGQRTDGRCGLFYGLSTGATVKNLNFADVNINLPECQNVGAVAGTMQNVCLVQNVHVRSGSIVGESRVGGLVGTTYNNDAAITDCSNAASISGSSNVGGIIGYNMYRFTLSGCANSGAVAATNFYAGGIIGNSDNSKVTITNSTNSGAVSASNNAGGIIGEFAEAEISGCGNTGTVTAGSEVGGIVGWMRGASSVVSMCYNVAHFNFGDKSASSVGGIVGRASDGQIVDCYNFGDLIGRDIRGVGGILGSVTSSLPQVAYCLNEGNVAAGNDECGLISGAGAEISVTACYAKADCSIAYYTNSQYIDLQGAKRFCRMSKAAPLVGSVIAADATEADYLSGALAYALQGGRTGIHWGQDFSNYDTEPQLGSDKTVYFSGTVNCAGETVDGYFTNAVVAPVVQDHVFDAFDVCTGCHKGHEPVLSFGIRQISTVGHLVWLQQEVEVGRAEHDAILMDDIDLADYCDAQPDGKGWTPIGTNRVEYQGEFNGNGRWITGLKINRPSDSYIGLFGAIDNNSIENLTVSGDVKGDQNTALICGWVGTNSSISYCTSRGEVTGVAGVGGIVGHAYGPISQSGNLAVVRGEKTVGGIVGYGQNTIADCFNTGDIYRLENYDSNCRIGGIAGEHYHYSKLLHCENYGTIHGDGGNYVGGIVGWISQSGVTAGASYCINVAQVIGRERVGGIVGYASTTSIDRCFSMGDITSDYSSCGAIIGDLAYMADGSAPEHLYYGVSHTMNVGGSAVDMTDAHGGIGVTDYEVNNGCVAARIGLPFGQEIGVDSHPNLNGPEVWYGKHLVHADEEPAYATPRGSNSEHLTEVYEPHHIEGGVCTICGRHDGEAISRQPAASYEDWESTIQGQNNGVDSHSWTFVGAEVDDKIDFDWTVSSEGSWDYLRVYITTPSGVRTELLEKSGEYSNHHSYAITEAGTYILEAEYSKDGSGNDNDDKATLTNVTGPAMLNNGINANLDGIGGVDMGDVNYLRSVLTRYIKPDDAKCDFNGDGRVTIADLNLLIKHLLP